ncbi:MAG: SPOR domain-containing protein [Polymorphobacter sp.]
MARRDQDDDDAPWLAEAGDRPRTTVSKRSLFWTVAVLLGLAAVAAIGLILLLSKKDNGSTQGYMNAEQAPLITAEPGPYKVPPLDPKGLTVEGQDQTIYAAGEGIDAGSVIDQSAVPETPLPRPGTAPPPGPPGPPRDLMPEAMAGATLPPAPAAVPSAAILPANPATTATAKPTAPAVKPPATATKPPLAAPKPPATGNTTAPKPAATKPEITTAAPKKAGVVQLGAFSSPELANAAWAKLTGKHALGGASKRIITVESGGKTLYRLRASGDATEICRKLKAAGDACTIVE